MGNKKKIIVLFVCLLTIFLCDCSNSKNKRYQGKKDRGRTKKGDTEAIPVQVIKAQRRDISSFILFSSNIDTEGFVDIYPMTSGIVKKILKDEGDIVKKNQVLAKLDDREALINEKKAKVNYEQLKNEFQRQETIYEKKLISKEAFEKLKYNVLQAKLDWQQKKLMLSYTNIVSPIKGSVSKRNIKEGNKINSSDLAFSVVNTKEKIVTVNIPENDKESVFKGQKTIIFTERNSCEGYVKRISPAIDPASGTIKVTVNVTDKKDKFSIGEFVNVKIIKKTHKNALIINKEALIFEGGKIFAFVLKNKNTVEKRILKTSFEDEKGIEIISGIKDEEQVVTAGKSSLKDGNKIKIINSIFK